MLSKHRRRQVREAAHHDLRSRYGEADLPFMNGVGVATIEDPYSEAARVDRDGNLDVRARLERARHFDGSIAEGAPSWTPPQRPRLTVVTALREDPIGRMYARRQINEPQFHAARTYQGLIDDVEVSGLRSLDLEKTKVDGTRFSEPYSDRKRRLAARLRNIERTVIEQLGSTGLSIARAVLNDRKSVEVVAKEHGAESERDIRSVGWLFRKCLDVLAQRLGFLSSTRQPRCILRQMIEPADDLGRKASTKDLANPALRRGRAGQRGTP